MLQNEFRWGGSSSLFVCAWFSEHNTPENTALPTAKSHWTLFLTVATTTPVLIVGHLSHSRLCSTTWRGLRHKFQPLQGALAWAMRKAPCCSAPDPEHHTSKCTRVRQLRLPCNLDTDKDQNGLAVLHFQAKSFGLDHMKLHLAGYSRWKLLDDLETLANRECPYSLISQNFKQ